MIIKSLDIFLPNLRVRKIKLRIEKRKRNRSLPKNKNKVNQNSSNLKKLKQMFHNGVKILLKVTAINEYN